MTSCCNAHDICYDTCNSNRDKCDDDFKKCLDVMCEKLKREITRNQYEGEEITVFYHNLLDRQAWVNSIDPDQTRRLIWIYTAYHLSSSF